ncbi:RNA polymerase sigma factor [Lysinibacillus sp. 2017]|uniref:RNA polymerase sigma factor n=1 Tax=unclassified Lysinibacillus TaxID=2636778 RepID=UPI000D5268EA|nr:MULTISPECIES: RNA polymerase sigma factor [unclassified Lysinibacillus]AWE07094.1 RNA polymerase sigma factor [Lysinibacillus sp. 2017]TGN36987.1 RNA polymerase sigma factor [Lysinibacillus sp. S2017]
MTERELFDAYNKDVYRTCYYMMRNAQDAEDLCHDVFITVFRQDWKSVEHTRAWIMRIAMNHCLNLLKRNQTQREKQSQVQWLHEQTSTSVKSVDTIVIEHETSTEWEEVLKQLPDKLMAVVTLRYIGELSMVEIAETLEIPVGTVKSRLHKALKIMRKKLENNQSLRLKGENQFGTH